MPWYLYLAFKQLFPTGKRFSFFSAVAILGVTLGVMILIIVQSVMNGFGHRIEETLNKTGGDLRVEGTSMIRQWKDLQAKILSADFVEGASANVYGPIMLKHNASPAFPLVRGIDIKSERTVVPIDDFVVQGDLDRLDDDSIILGSILARNIGATVGSTVEVYTPLMLQRLKEDEILLPRELEVVGIYDTGFARVDENSAISSLRLMQELYGMEQGVHGFNVKLKPGVNLENAERQLNALLGEDFRVMSWLEAHSDFLFLLKMEKTMMFFIILFVILVASFSIASSLMTTVVRKTKEIGLLSAMGARAKHIAATYCAQGFIIGITGTVLGILGALSALHFRNEIVKILAGLVHRQEAMERFYGFSDIPVHYMMSDFIVVTIFSILIATLAGLLPAIRAARLKPSEALRNE